MPYRVLDRWLIFGLILYAGECGFILLLSVCLFIIINREKIDDFTNSDKNILPLDVTPSPDSISTMENHILAKEGAPCISELESYAGETLAANRDRS